MAGLRSTSSVNSIILEMKKINLLFAILILFVYPIQTQSLAGFKVLLFTKNGKGYVHDNIPAAKHCFDSLSHKHGFVLKINDSSFVFNREYLSKIDLIIFASTNNNVFDTDEQRLAFRHFIEAGGLFLGIHSVLGTERTWTWFKQFLGGSFSWHPKFQPFQVINIRKDHPSVKNLPAIWNRKDECYFMKELYPGPLTLMAADLTTLAIETSDSIRLASNKGTFNKYYPSVWEHRYDGGLAWITALGHALTDYSEPQFVGHLFQGMLYLKTQKRKLDYTKAYAKSFDDPLNYGSH